MAATNRQPETETAARHTPGPWTVVSASPSEEPGLGTFWGLTVEAPSGFDDSGWTVAYLDLGDESDPPDDVDREVRDFTLANARLIAAAPDLLAACKVLVAALKGVDFGLEMGGSLLQLPAIKAAAAAIARAEGGAA